MQKVILLLALIAFTGFANTTIGSEELHVLWNSWKAVHKKVYATAEEVARFAIFMENHKKVLRWNAENDSVKLALNLFADLTSEEFKALYTGSGFAETNQEVITENTLPLLDTTANLGDIDWRNGGKVTVAKNQGQCGSCWAFSTTGALESKYAIEHGVLPGFSEQQLVDCAKNAGSGCSGGWPYLAFQYVAENGIEQEYQYPYTARDGQCQYNSGIVIRPNSGYAFIQAHNADQLKAGINVRPISVLIEADQNIFQLYGSGVINAFQGCGANIDHAVLAIGYGNVQGQDAFVVKNSWGEGWGQDGFVYISTDGGANGGAGVCGILYQPVIPS